MVELSISVWLLTIVVTDARARRIPNVMVWPGLSAVALSAVAQPSVGLAAATAATPYLLTFAAGWCGGGDVKLAFACGGLTLSWDTALVMVALAALLSLVAVPVATTAETSPTARSRGRAHAPALVGALIVVSDLL
ncbi:A24 family peptidase [Gordonia amicalis]|uniref:A24 family peptidase n=1 Tax=Gordonia amicalis TaxID=89053 RepID=UPI0022B308A0|nr:A24 family peptidase [Gordonia amicalis]MCZ4577820.1 A24 family peptidase [Gordonia amicalis]